MTDLERVREIVQENCVLDSEHGDLTADGYEADRIIDAHLKEDEERDEAWRHEAQLQQDRYTALREGVRREAETFDRIAEGRAGEGVHQAARLGAHRLRQLIEEKE